MALYISGERCPNIMTSGIMLTSDLIDSPLNDDDKEKVIPGGLPYVTDEDETDIIVSLQNEEYESGDLTKVLVTSTNVLSITISIQDENGLWIPYSPTNPNSNQPEEFESNSPVVFEPRFPGATKVKITLKRENSTEPMSAEVDIWACLKLG